MNKKNHGPYQSFVVTMRLVSSPIIIFTLAIVTATMSYDPLKQVKDNSHKEDGTCNELTTNYGKVCVCDGDYCDVAPKVDVPEGGFQLITTSINKPGFQSTNGTLMTNSERPANNIIRVIPTQQQTILGFGGAFTDSTGYNINSLTEAAQENLLNSYFGEDGIQYSFGRVPIGGNDFSLRLYAYDSVDGDVDLQNFTLQEEDFTYKIPYIKKALELTNNDLKLFASSWTAPIWMKINNYWSGVGYLKYEHYQTWADYYIRFFQEYAKEGIDFWGVTTQNEPADGASPRVFSQINSMAFSPGEMIKWIVENFGPTLKNSEFKDLKIMVHDDNRVSLPLLPWQIENDDILQYVDGVAVHWYEDFLLPEIWLTNTKSSKKDLFLILSEACNGFLQRYYMEKAVELGSWKRGVKYIKSILSILRYGGGGWVDFNMVLNEEGGPMVIRNNVDSPIIVNKDKNEFYKQPMFYALGHFSKYVRPDSAVVVTTTENPTEGLSTVAFIRPDEKIVVTLLNEGRTSLDVEVQVNESSAFITIDAHSINTLLV